MNLEKRFRDISLFLKQHKYILDLEILKRYPEQLPDYFEKWIDQILDFSLEDLVQLENNFQSKKPLSSDLKIYLNKIKEFATIEKPYFKETPVPKSLIPKLNIKKKHEVQILKTLIGKIEGIDSFLDIGSGAGHLSSFLVDGESKNSICVDRNQFFQEQGKKRLKKYSPENLEKIKFINNSFDKDFYSKGISQDTLVLGLHSCGDLSSEIIEFYRNNKLSHLVNIGCCYQDLNGKYNLSIVAKEEALVFTKNTLHLAARSYSFTNPELMKKKFEVRGLRYALHFLLYKNGQKEFVGIGNGTPVDYSMSFAHYAKKFCPREFDNFSDDYLNDYFLNPDTKQKIKRVILGDILRGLMGRLIELYIICDRALFLKENRQDVNLSEIFDRKLSPRNLCIQAKVVE